MNYEKVKYLQYKHLGEWYRQGDIEDAISHKQTKMYSKFTSCGKVLNTRFGMRYYQCRLITCPYCCKDGASRLANRFLCQYPLAGNDGFKQVTLGLGYCYEADEIFWMFKNARNKLGTGLANMMRSKSEKMKPWMSFSMVGSLDVTSFKVNEFELLGSNKQDRFINKYGFEPRSTNQEHCFEPHIHSVVHCDGISEDALYSMFGRYASSVAIGDLYSWQSLDVNTHKYLAYSSKVRLATKLADGKIVDWDKEQIQDYGRAVSLERGQQGRMLFIGDRSLRTE